MKDLLDLDKPTKAKERARRALARAKGDSSSFGEGEIFRKKIETGTSAARLNTHHSLIESEHDAIDMAIELERPMPDKMTVERQMQIASPLPRCLLRPKPQPVLKRIHGLDGEVQEAVEN